MRHMGSGPHASISAKAVALCSTSPEELLNHAHGQGPAWEQAVQILRRDRKRPPLFYVGAPPAGCPRHAPLPPAAAANSRKGRADLLLLPAGLATRGVCKRGLTRTHAGLPGRAAALSSFTQPLRGKRNGRGRWTACSRELAQPTLDKTCNRWPAPLGRASCSVGE